MKPSGGTVEARGPRRCPKVLVMFDPIMLHSLTCCASQVGLRAGGRAIRARLDCIIVAAPELSALNKDDIPGGAIRVPTRGSQLVQADRVIAADTVFEFAVRKFAICGFSVAFCEGRVANPANPFAIYVLANMTEYTQLQIIRQTRTYAGFGRCRRFRQLSNYLCIAARISSLCAEVSSRRWLSERASRI